MDEIARLGDGGVVGVASIVVAVGFYAFRKLYHSDRVAGTNASAAVDALKKMRDLLDYERDNARGLAVQLQASYVRIEELSQERNTLILEIGSMNGRLQALEHEVRMLREKLDD